MLEITRRRLSRLRRRITASVPAGGRAGADWPDPGRHAAAPRRAGRATGRPTRDTSVILIWKGGGPSHLDMWDLKPDAPAEYRGEFKPIATNVPGHLGRRAPAAVGQGDGQVRDPALGHASRRGARVGQPLPADRLSARPTTSPRRRCRATARSPPGCAGRGGRACRRTWRCPARPGAASAGYLGVAYNPFSVGGDPSQDELLGPQPDPAQRDQPRPSARTAGACSRRSTPSAATATDRA